MKSLLSLIAVAMSLVLQAQQRPSTSDRQPQRQSPNVILILADDLGYGDLSAYGQQQWATPNIDQLASEGVKLTQFYTPTPYCAPTRASLLTGLYPVRHGLTSNPNPEKVKNNFQTYRGGDDIGIDDKQL